MCRNKNGIRQERLQHHGASNRSVNYQRRHPTGLLSGRRSYQRRYNGRPVNGEKNHFRRQSDCHGRGPCLRKIKAHTTNCKILPYRDRRRRKNFNPSHVQPRPNRNGNGKNYRRAIKKRKYRATRSVKRNFKFLEVCETCLGGKVRWFGVGVRYNSVNVCTRVIHSLYHTNGIKANRSHYHRM